MLKYRREQLQRHRVRSTSLEWSLVSSPQLVSRLALPQVFITPQRRQRPWNQCNTNSRRLKCTPVTPHKRRTRKLHSRCSSPSSVRRQFLLQTMSLTRTRTQIQMLLRASRPITNKSRQPRVVLCQPATLVFINTIPFDKEKFTTSCATTVSLPQGHGFLFAFNLVNLGNTYACGGLRK